MKLHGLLSSALLLGAFALPSLAAQHAQVSAVVADPTDSDVIWVCNRDNASVSVIDTSTSPAGVVEIAVGNHPRSLSFSADGTRVFVANERGEVALDANFVTGFGGAQFGGSVSVIDTATRQVLTTMANVGVEPYGVSVAPNGAWFAVSGYRSGTIKFYDAQTLTLLHTHQFLRNLNQIPNPFTIKDADVDRDGLADLGDPRGFVIRDDSARMYVTHFKSPFISVLDLTLDGNGLVTTSTLNSKITTDEYPFDPIYNPVPVQTLKSQGKPRYLEDIALSPDSSRLLVPHVLTNVNHDVNHDFGAALAGDFANRVYPALTMIDGVAQSYGQPGDASNRLHHELGDDLDPAEYVPYGSSMVTSAGNRIVLGGTGSPELGGTADFVISGLQAGDTARLLYGTLEANVPTAMGTFLVRPRFNVPVIGGQVSVQLPSAGGMFEDFDFYAQALVTLANGTEFLLSNGVQIHLDNDGFGLNKMGYRGGHPSRVLFNSGGDHALMLNRGSEDVFLYSVAGSDMELRTVFPRRSEFVERAALDTTTPMGDLPLGMALVEDSSTINDDATLYIVNETTRTLSALRIDYTAGTIEQALDQVPLLTGPDAFTLSERIGEELFEDASRPQTTGNFNNSCTSCHFEGGDDANVWQRPAGPRSTMPVFGGATGSGLLLWKGVRLNMGETGPMFGGENGGHGLFSDAQQQGLNDYHSKLSIPLNPNLDPVTGDLSPLAELGKDLFLGSNDTGLNPTLRNAGCAVCHPMEDLSGSDPGPRFFTADFVSPLLTNSQDFGSLDPNCFSLRENIIALNIRNVNTGANFDMDGDGIPEMDRNNDGFNDLETYAIMNRDIEDDFTRDDPNDYLCPCTPGSAGCSQDGFRIFTRRGDRFSIPTKLGVFGSAPYFHDHVAYSLRTLLDPAAQALSPKYGTPAFPGQTAYPGLNKIFNEEHDIIGHQQFGGFSDVQGLLQSTDAQADLEAILAFIQSL